MAAATTGDSDQDPFYSGSYTGGGGEGEQDVPVDQRNGWPEATGCNCHRRPRDGVKLLSRQQNFIKQYRDDGIRAYYKGKQLGVGGRSTTTSITEWA